MLRHDTPREKRRSTASSYWLATVGYSAVTGIFFDLAACDFFSLIVNHAVGVLGRHVVDVDPPPQVHGPMERTVGSLAVVVVAAFRFVGFLFLVGQGQAIARNGNLQVLG